MKYVKVLILGVIIGIMITCGVSIANTVLVENVYYNKYPIYLNGSVYYPTNTILNYKGKTYLPLSEFGNVTKNTILFDEDKIYINNPNYSYFNNDSVQYSLTTTYPPNIDSSKNTASQQSTNDMSASNNGNSNVDGNSNTKASNTDCYSSPRTIEANYTVNVDEELEYYIDLEKYNAESASILGNFSCIELSKTKFSSSRTLKIEGVKYGNEEVKIVYNNGSMEILNITVIENKSYKEEIEIEEGETYKICIDLDYYNSDEAKIVSDDEYVQVSKSKFIDDGYLTITAIKTGKTTIKIKYSSDDIIQLNFNIKENSKKSNGTINLEKNDTYKIFVDLQTFDASNAEIIYDDEYVNVSKDSFSSNGYLTITAIKKGETTVKIKYDSVASTYYFFTIE